MLRRTVLLATLCLVCAVWAGAQEAPMETGPSQEIKDMAQVLTGEFDVEFEYRWDPTKDWQKTTGEASVYPVLDGSAIQMDFSAVIDGMKFKGRNVLTYHRGLGKWRESWVDNMSASLTMYEGSYEDGVLVTAGTNVVQGMTMHFRSTVKPNKKGFTWKQEMSMDGESYMEAAKATYTRRSADSGAEDEDEGGW